MFLLPAVLVGVLLGYALGGRLSRLADVRLRAPWLFYLAIALQLAAFPSLFMPLQAPEQLATVLSIASYAALLAVFLLNLRLAGMPLAGAGMILNLVAILANGGHMPALPSAMRHAGLTYTGVHNNSIAEASPRLAWIVDRWAAPRWEPFANVFSVGDVLIAAGVLLLVAGAMGAWLPWRGRPAQVTPADPAA